MEFRNPFGLRNNQIILIEDISKNQNGLKCNCICPSCKEPFEARMGNIRRHHFAHSGQGCDEVNAYLTGLYMLLNEYLSNQNPIHLPPVIVAFDLSADYYLSNYNIEEHIRLLSESFDKSHEILFYPASKIHFDSSRIIKNNNSRPQAIIAEKMNKTLAIRVTPPNTVCKFGMVSKYKEYPTVEMDLSEAEDLICKSNKEAFFQYLMNNTSGCRWIYNPKIVDIYPQIMECSRIYYEDAQIQKKKEEAKRKEETERQVEEFKRRQRENEDYIAEIKSDKEKKKIEEMFTGQQVTAIRDRWGVRWVQCEKCHKIKQEFDFGSYGGVGRVNLGICKEYYRK